MMASTAADKCKRLQLAIAYGSPRFTTDLDFTAREFAVDAPEALRSLLNPALTRAAAALGYVDLRCRVQKVKQRPNPSMFAGAGAPALDVTIGAADNTPGGARRLDAGAAADILEINISYREPLMSFEEASLLGKVEPAAAPRRLLVYSVAEIVAEKLRAYLQQRVRNRSRRQDVYDLAWLIGEHDAELDRAAVLAALREKARARGIEPDPGMIDDPECVSRARQGWDTLKAEVGQIPEFEECFVAVREFYLSLPWQPSA